MIQQKEKDEDNDDEDRVVQMRRDTEMEMSERTITRKLKTRQTYTRSIHMDCGCTPWIGCVAVFLLMAEWRLLIHPLYSTTQTLFYLVLFRETI